MKVKHSLSISNKKKNALPSSKLLKPKKFKSSVKKSGDVPKASLSEDKLKLVKENVIEQVGDTLRLIKGKTAKKSKNLKNSVGFVDKPKQISLQNSPDKSNISLKKPKNEKIPLLFDFMTSQAPKEKTKVKDKLISTSTSKKQTAKTKVIEKKHFTEAVNEGKRTQTPGSNKRNLKASMITSSKLKKEEKVSAKNRLRKKGLEDEHNELKKQQLSKIVDNYENKGSETRSFDKCTLKESKVAAVAKGLLGLIRETSSSKPEMLDVGEPIFLQVECVKIPICPIKQLRFKLPHSLIDETADVLLITADLKGHKIYPDKAIEHYEELLEKLQIKFISKVMPMRMIKKEHSQYELKRKLVDQFDLILADSRIIKSLPAVLGKFVMYKRKMPVPVNLTIGEAKLKKHLQDNICKTQMTVKSNGHSSVVQVGHSKMSGEEIGANIVEVAKLLEKMYPGGWRNIRSLVIKSAKSTSVPVYLSLISPNDVRIPVEVPKKSPAVEDELSTMPGFNVIVTEDGNVILKKVEEEFKIDDSKDDEILEEAQKYLESSKTVRYDESSDEDGNVKENGSDDEGDAITEAMEKKLMNKYEKNAKAKKNKGEEEEGQDEEEDDEEEDDESEEEIEIVPVTGTKRKSQGTKKQSGPPTKKVFHAVEAKKKNNDKSSKDSKKASSPGFSKPQMRGTRGGKKNKLSKDQRKALIKRKKAGKK